MADLTDCKKYATCPLRADGGCIDECSCYASNDVVRVVRCKDCVHMRNVFNGRYCKVWCMFNGMGDDGFCNYGEKEEDC